MENYDFIGDIHGHADELESLLKKLGYQKGDEGYYHPEGRKVIFLGDYIDRGPKIRETLHIVKTMVDNGNAEAIMGNHEFNAVCFHTPDMERGGFFRAHTIKEIKQHFQTLEQFAQFPEEWERYLNWFKTLPIFIEKEQFRCIHACWENEKIDWVRSKYHGLNESLLKAYAHEESPVFEIIETLLKGVESLLPNGKFFVDKDGTKREMCRVKWWQPKNQRLVYEDVLQECPEDLKNEQVKEELLYYSEDKFVFFGHYWLKGTPKHHPESKAICLDYSVAKGGLLVAFRGSFKDNIENGFVY
ncbi:MAG: hypothetical protein RL264_141 [Bacteroidota bacterium]|jgi:hypothetical protein